jgi:DNA repair protein RadD
VDRIEASSARKIIACAPTGSGKTLMSLELTRRAMHRGQRICHLVPRRELIDQLVWKMAKWQPTAYGVIAAKTKHRQSAYSPVQIGSVDTLVSRVIRRGRGGVPLADLVLVDEAHLYQTHNRMALMELFPDTTRFVFFTATPCRFDGRAMGLIADELLEIETVKGLIDKGILVQPIYYSPSTPDLKRMKKVAGDYNKAQASERMEPLLGDIVEHWLEKNSDRITVVYANSVGQSAWLAQRFRELGIAAEHCDGGYEDTARDEIMTRFRRGETQVLCNVDLLTYGFDLPELSCAVIARPTLSISRYLQMGGRAIRAFPGKTDAVIQDHSGCVREHGYLEEDRIWNLEGKTKISTKMQLRPPTNGERKDPELKLECPECHLIFAGALRCTNCGFYYERVAKKFRVVEGHLVRLGGEPAVDNTEKIAFYRELLGYAHQKGYKFGWAAHAYEWKYKSMPPREWATQGPLDPSAKTSGFIKVLSMRRRRQKKTEAA